MIQAPRRSRVATAVIDETQGRHLSRASGKEYLYVFAVLPGGKEIWWARVFRDDRLVCVLARGLVEHELNTQNVIEHVRSLIVSHIDSLR